MDKLRHTIEVKEGVKVEMLFTPRLYRYKGTQGVTFEADKSNLADMFGLYADIMFCAAMNAWTLKGNDEADAPFEREDFHIFQAIYPKEFAAILNVAIKALTGKDLAEHAKIAEGSDKEQEGEEVKKKKISGWITRLLRRFS